MRALNSRRPRPTSIILGARPHLFLLLLTVPLLLHDGARARSLPGDVGPEAGNLDAEDRGLAVPKPDEEKVIARSDQLPSADEVAHDKDARKVEEVQGAERKVDQDIAGDVREESANVANSDGEEKLGVEESERKRSIGDEDVDALKASEDEEGSVVKKRRRNDVVLNGAPAKVRTQDGEHIYAESPDDQAESKKEGEGIRRFDAQVDADDESENQTEERTEEGRKRLIDVEESELERKEPERKSAEIVAQEFDGSGTEDAALATESAPDFVPTEEDLEDENRQELEALSEGKTIAPDDQEELQTELRNLEKSDDVPEDSNVEEETNRDQRNLNDPAQRKSKFKSSTVYLNAEEEGTSPDGEQESIVDGQIKKLISIRDDALGSTDNSENLEEAKLLTAKDIDLTSPKEDEDEHQEADDPRFQRSNSNRFIRGKFLLETRNEALRLQDQIKDKAFLDYINVRRPGILPSVPKFTEGQLLETLRRITSMKEIENAHVSYLSKLDTSRLTERQLEIIRCAERLIEVRQRQSFVDNMVQCIRGLSVLNCMRIFVWPILVDNMPSSIVQTFENLPIEINIADLFQGNRGKRAGSLSYITPESVLFTILKDALDHYPDDSKVPTFIDPKNETLQKLLTPGQIQLLQMAERLLPQNQRPQYSDTMFSCVRRFEYFSCMRYFAWPMLKRNIPALSSFPSYQGWYPWNVPLDVPYYPIIPFPIEEIGELPEVVEADATRRTKPETVIVNILRNSLREHQKMPITPSTINPNLSPYITLMPQAQLQTLYLAEQLVPAQVRTEFVQKTVKCMQDYNYYTCIKYSTWPTMRQFVPSLPDLSQYIPDLSQYIPDSVPSLSDLFGYLPNLSTFTGLFSFLPGGTTTPQAVQVEPADPVSEVRRHGTVFNESNILEARVTNILTKLRDSSKQSPDIPPLLVTGNVIVLTAITEKQINILRLSESVLPPPVRAALVTHVLACLQNGRDFMSCTKYVIWPTISLYTPNLPAFPDNDYLQPIVGSNDIPEHNLNLSQDGVAPETIEPAVKIASRTPFQHPTSRENIPVISVTGTRFVPIFTEQPEVVLLNILKSVQLSSPNVIEQPKDETKNKQLADVFSQQQETIVRITESLIPDSVRPQFLSRMTECVRNGNFLLCSRDVLWPTLTEYFPRLPSFPNFGILSTPTQNGSASESQDVNELRSSTEHLSETNVKVGQHGDATVTYTDTRFFPIFTELPEAVILNILTAIRLSIPNPPQLSPLKKSQELLKYLNEQQYHIVRLAESLLPESAKPGYVSRIIVCVREGNFLDCTRDITWPAVAQFYPRLPNFPNFGSLQNLPRTNLNSQSVLSLSTLPESNNQAPVNATDKKDVLTIEQIEAELESILKTALSKESRLNLEHSYLDVNNPLISILITNQEANIIRLTEKGLPDSVKPIYVMRMLECIRRENFISCTQHVGWPTLKQFVPNIPDFPPFGGYFPTFGGTFADQGTAPQLPPGIAQYPDAITGYPGVSQITEGIQYPNVPQYPTGGLQVVDGVQQITQGFPQFGGYPSFGIGILKKPDQLQKLSARHLSFPELTEEEFKEILNTDPAPATTPSVDNAGIVPGYAGQPAGILLDINEEKITLPDHHQKLAKDVLSKTSRRRRSVVDLLKLHHPDEYENEKLDNIENVERSEKLSGSNDAVPFPNITESEFLQLLVNISKTRKMFVTKDSLGKPLKEEPKEYFVDTLNDTIKNSLTADQYQILKLVETLKGGTDPEISRGFMQRVVQCIMSLSFIRCMGIFIWPVIQNNLPTVPSISSLLGLPNLGIFSRSTEEEVERYLGMSTYEFEKELIIRKESIEKRLVSWYKRLSEDEFRKDVGMFNIRGHGNGELSIGMSGSREGRASKIKDNKNLPSILTIISDIMEEVLDQRPDIDKAKREKEKKDRSVDYHSLKQERKSRSMDAGMNYQMLPDEEDAKSKDSNGKQRTVVDDNLEKRSINDEQLITMFLDKIKSNSTDFGDDDVRQYVNLEDAYNAFGLLFGTRMNGKRSDNSPSGAEDELTPDESSKEFDVIPLESQATSQLTVINRNPEKFAENLDVLPLETQTKAERQTRTPDETIKEFNIVPLEAQGKEYLRSLVNDEQDHSKKFKILPLEAQVNYDLAKETLEDQKEQNRHDRTKNTYAFLSKHSDYNQKDPRPEFSKRKPEKEGKDEVKKILKSVGKELVVQLPRLNDEIVPKKMTSAILSLGRGIKVKMTDMMPGIGLVVSFIVQLMLSHARAAASVAGLLSNMALGSAVLGMMREMMFGSDTHPKIKYVYDNEKYAPMITWPFGMHDG